VLNNKFEISKLSFTCPSDRGGKILAFSARVFPVTIRKKINTMSLPKKIAPILHDMIIDCTHQSCNPRQEDLAPEDNELLQVSHQSVTCGLFLNLFID